MKSNDGSTLLEKALDYTRPHQFEACPLPSRAPAGRVFCPAFDHCICGEPPTASIHTRFRGNA
jgi:hypothetical protein